MTQPTPVPINEPIRGPHGYVHPVPYPSLDEPGLSDVARAAIEVGVCTYLITSPGWHPLWSQYVLSVINLRDHPTLPPAVRKFDGATHELMVLALHPEKPRSVEDMTGHCRNGDLPFLKPVNLAEQFEAADEEMHAVAWLAARAIVHGQLNPETADSPSYIRGTWLVAVTQTLAHLRGEQHAGQS